MLRERKRERENCGLLFVTFLAQMRIPTTVAHGCMMLGATVSEMLI
jgi:hypothetical protein